MTPDDPLWTCPRCAQPADEGCAKDCTLTQPTQGCTLYVPGKRLSPDADVDDALTAKFDAPVMGVEDVARGRGVVYPETIYKRRNESWSGVVGMLYPPWDFHPKWSPTTGTHFVYHDLDDFEVYECEVVWCGADPSPMSPTPIGFEDEAQTKPVFQEHSKGILLGGYDTNGELWRALQLWREMR